MANEDHDALDAIEREAKDYEKDAEIDRIMKAFGHDGYAVMDLQPGVPESEIKIVYRKKSLLIHPDKSKNPQAKDAFEKLKQAQVQLTDEKQRKHLDECISDARQLLMRQKKLTADDEETRSDEFLKEWRATAVKIIIEGELRKRRQADAQRREEGRERAKEDADIEARKRKRDHEKDWEATRESRIGNWRDFQKGNDAKTAKKKRKTAVLG